MKGKKYETREQFIARVGKKHPKPSGCSGCPLQDNGAGFASSDGLGSNGILLVGEALDATEAELGLPFKGQAGSQLNAILHRIAHKRNEYLIANTISCQPPISLSGAPFQYQAIEHCSPYLDAIIAKNPHIKVIVPMGQVAMSRFLPEGTLYGSHGTRHWNSKYKKWIVPTMHPKDVMLGGCKEVLTVINDLNAAFDVRDNGYTEPVYDFIMDTLPPEEYLQACKKFVTEYETALFFNDNLWLSVDIETPYSADIDEEEKDGKDSSWTVERISFAFRSGHAITMPWTGPFIGLALRLLGGWGSKIFWNGNKFDVPRLRQHGPIEGSIIDGMDLFHFLYSDLPKGLGYASPFFTRHKAWKHLAGSNMPYYSCMDALGALDIAVGARERLEHDGLWDAFIRDFVNIEPTFQSLTATGIGIDTTVKERLKDHYVNLRDNSTTKIQAMVPEDVKPFIKKDGYKGLPLAVRAFKSDNPGVNNDDAWAALGYKQYACGPSSELRYNKRGDFNPNSGPQIQQYIITKYGKDALPRNKKTGGITTGNEEIERLAKRYNDEVLFTIIDATSAGDKLSSFIENWIIGSDGRVHPTFSNNPATFRLSSVRPNSQNFPNRSAELNLLREMLVGGQGPEDDWWIVEADYSGIEAIEVGWYAHDPDYMRLAKKGIHSYVAGVKLGLDINPKWEDTQLDAALKAAKQLSKKTECYAGGPSVYDAVKRGIHGSNYLMGEGLLHDTYPDLFPSRKEAREFQDFYFALCANVPKWQRGVIDHVYDTCCTLNDFGYRRWFWDAKKWVWSQRINNWELVPSGDAKKIVATLPQGSAAAIIRRAMLSSAFQKIVQEGKAMIQIHDSLVCRAQRHEIDRVVSLLREAMVYPIPEQNGLVIPIEVKVGKNWRSSHGKHESGCPSTCTLNKNGMKEVATFVA